MKIIRDKLHLNGLIRKVNLFLVNCVFRGTNKICCKFKRHLLNMIGCSIGENTVIVGPIDCRGTLNVGKDCWIGKNLKINGNGVVTIGDNCDLGPEVTFQTGGHEIGDSSRRAGSGLVFNQNVGSGTWIGGRVTICNDACIGDGVVIASCACVTKDIPNNVLVGGVPARIIRRLP